MPQLLKMPKGWSSAKLKHFASCLYGLSQPPEYAVEGIPFVRATNIDRGRIVKEGLVFVAEASLPNSRVVRLRTGDIIVVRSGACTGDSAIVTTDWENAVAGFDMVVRIHRYADPRYISYCLLSAHVLEGQIDPLRCRAAQPHLNAEELGDVEFLLPPLAEQRVIADFLECETARLDGLVAAKEKVLQLLAEKRRSLISQAVTRGLQPSVPLRDSGVPWIGQIPAHWEMERARWLFTERDERSESGDEELLTVSHITGVTRRSEKDVNMFEAETTEGYKICLRNDLVINTLWAWMGAMGVSPIEGIVSPAYNVYIPARCLDPGYVDAMVRMPVFAEEATRYSKGVWSSRLRLYPESFFEIWMPVPPLEEQQSIVTHIRREISKLDALRASAERTIGLLKERRSAVSLHPQSGWPQVAPPEGGSSLGKSLIAFLSFRTQIPLDAFQGLLVRECTSL